MLVDAHINVWTQDYDPRAHPPAWLPEHHRHGRTDRTLADIAPDLKAARVDGTVLVQTANHLAHTSHLLQEAAGADVPTTVVGWLPIDEPKATSAALAQYSDEPLLVGVRHRILDTEDPQLLLRATTARSLDLITTSGLALDVLPWPHQVLAQVPILARRHPDLQIVIDLMGWPRIADRHLQPWTDEIAAVAAEPNTFLKVSGLHRMSTAPIDVDAWQPYISTAVELFGASRMMIGSDWPALRMYGIDYGAVLRALAGAFFNLTPGEREWVLGKTANSVYGSRA